jgi:ABC-2 type transport system ATP-binding protein
MTAPHHVIEARALTKLYEERVAVDRLDLTIERGEVVGLLGPNGAGKTTSILMLLGLCTPTAGHAVVDGIDPSKRPLEVKRRVGYVPDDVGFYDELTGTENLWYTARLNRVRSDIASERIPALLAEVGLEEAADRRVRGYSRGMRQRLGLADALVKDPSILVLDEPTVNIDPEGVREMLALIARLRDERGLTVLLSSHLLHQVEQVCDRIAILLRGRLVANGPVAELTAAVDGRVTIELECDGLDGNLDGIVRAVPSVRTVSREGSMVVISADRDVRAELASSVVSHGGRLQLLRRRGADLDALYHRWFGSEDPSERDTDGDHDDAGIHAGV